MSQAISTLPWWQKISIRNKLKFTIIGFSLLTLVIFTLAISITTYSYFHAKTKKDLNILANVFAENIRAAVVFDDSSSATTTLSALTKNPHIAKAIIFRNNKEFAIYPDKSLITEEESSEHTGTWLANGKYYISVPIIVAKQTIGKLVLVSNLQEWETVKNNLYVIFFSVLIGLVLLTSLISLWLENQITKPLHDISSWATEIAKTNRFTIGVTKKNDDEIGNLVDSLNTMISALLEQESIVTLNRKLLSEIKEREHAEKSLIVMRDNAEAANRAKSAFLATMSHEIRTPMNGVIGMISLLSDTELTPEQREYLQVIRLSGESLLSVINDILDYSKIESGHFQLESIDFDLRELIEDTVDMLAVRAYEKGLNVGAVINLDVPRWLNGDPVRIRQVLTNLLNNAVKFTPKGEIAVHVSLAETKQVKQEAGSVLLRVQVTDTGIGISPEIKKQLFKPFSQADSSTSRKFGGTGLGLVISKRIIQYMNGEINVESIQGRGSQFWFTMQLKLAIADQPDSKYDFAPKLEGVHLLVVDDCDVNRRITELQAKAWKMRCDVVENGMEALDKLQAAQAKNDPYQLALIDHVMPLMNGVELAEKIHAIPQNAQTAIVMMTSMGQTISTQDFRKIGVSLCLTKPVKQSKLYNCIMSVLQKNYLLHPADTAKLAQQNTGHIPTFKPVRILVAEDYPINQQVILSLLRKLGLTNIDVANNGLEVLNAIEKVPYDLILMDCQMPDMDGYTATRETRKMESAKGLTRIPIIAMTAHALIGDREKCLAAGMDDYVPKPIDRNELIRVLMKWIGDTTSNSNINSQPKKQTQPMTQHKSINCVIDREQLQSITGEEQEAMSRFLNMFINEIEPLFTSLAQAIQTRDFETSKIHCHHLKGSSGSCGANQMYELAKTLESKVLLKDWAEAEKLFQAEQAALAAVKEFANQL